MKNIFLSFLIFSNIYLFAQADSTNYKLFTVAVSPEIRGHLSLRDCEPSELVALENSKFLKPNFFLIEDYVLCSTENGPKLYFKIFNGERSYYVQTSDVEMTDKSKTTDEAMVYFSQLDLVEKWKYNKYFQNLIEKRSEQNALDEKIGRLERSLAYIDSFDKYGIGITDAVPYDDYGLTGARFRFYNASKKTIKYITFNFYGRNAVKDKVSSYGQVAFSRKGIGPIEPDSFASYEFDSVWITDIVQTLTLTSVNILYMNGTSKNIVITDDMWLDEDEIEALYEKD